MKHYIVITFFAISHPYVYTLQCSFK